MVTQLTGKLKVEQVVPWEPISCDPHLSLMQSAFFRLFKNYGAAMILTGLTAALSPAWLTTARHASQRLTTVPLYWCAGAAMIPPNAALRLVLPNGAECTVGNPKALPDDMATVRVMDGALFSKVVMRSDIGLGEAYMDGAFIADDLYKMMEVVSRVSCDTSAKEATYSSLGWLGGAMYKVSEALEMAAHRANSNTEEGSKRNISYHYDAGNDFYKLFLDNTMMYSSGIHPHTTPHGAALFASIDGLDFAAKEAELEAAQYRKLDAMIKRADLRPGEHVLEIGCGWGACAIRMAQKAGVHVTGITVSREQLAEARARVAAAGLTSQIDLIFCDYRKVEGQFDKVVSIEMLEAVGHEHLNSFFDCVHRYLKPGGLAAVQVITLPDDRYKAYCETHSDFIRTYIFPGGHLPSLGAMTAVSSRVGLELCGCADIGPDYAVSLRLWRQRMMARQEEILALGYPKRFIRMYEFYFVYCEAGFANGLIHDYQITWKKSHLAGCKAAAATATADGSAAPTAKTSPAIDPLTALLLLIWLALVVTLVLSKRHMALIGVTASAFFTLRAALQSKHLAAMPFSRASTVTALVAAVTLSIGSVLVLYQSVLHAPPKCTQPSTQPTGWGRSELPPVCEPRSMLAALAHMILLPQTPPELLDTARLVVGTAAGFAALRAWECVRDPKQRSLWEAAGYTASLICTSAALFHDSLLLGLVPTQLCEAHSLILRVRALRASAGMPPSSKLWTAAWLAYALLRVVPHFALLILFGLAPGLPRLSRIALLGLAHINLNNVAIGWGMLRAQTGEARTLALEAAVHRSSEEQFLAPTPPPAATSPPLCVPWALVSGCVACVLGYVTTLQEPKCARLITATSAFYACFYALMRATGLLQPAAGTIKPAEFAEWRSRVGSTLSAIVLIIGALLCFSEWPYPAAEGWISDHLWSHPVTFASMFVGYLQFDLCWVLYHQRATPDPASAIHHSLFIAITHYVLWGWYFKQPYAWLSFAELSTPFLNLRWFLAVADMKSGKAYLLASWAFALTFLVTRVGGYAWGIFDIWRSYHLWKVAKPGLYAVVAGCHAGFALNLFWSQAVIGALLRAAGGGKKPKAKAA